MIIDREPPRLKQLGGRLGAALESLERQLPSQDELHQQFADLRSKTEFGDTASGIRGSLQTETTAASPQPQPRRPVQEPCRPKPRKPGFQPSWTIVACAAAAGALLTLALSKSSLPASHSIAKEPLPRREHAASGNHSRSRQTADPRESTDGIVLETIAVEELELEPEPDLGSAKAVSKKRSSASGRGRKREVYLADDPWALNQAVTAGAGRLNIESMPAMSVSVDGQHFGTTPVVGVTVRPGEHNVVFTHPERGSIVQKVEVAAGGTTLATVYFR